MELEHYSHREVALNELVTCRQKPGDRDQLKPRGLWLSVKGEYDWPWWCRAENWSLKKLTHRHAVELHDGANLLILNTPEEIVATNERYGEPFYPGSHYRQMKWTKMAQDYDGILIYPYQWSLRLNGPIWYYGWDCASGCVWNKEVIKDIRLLDITPLTEIEQKAEEEHDRIMAEWKQEKEMV